MPTRIGPAITAGLLAIMILTFVPACGTPDAEVSSYVEGQFTVREDVDSTRNYSGFEIAVVNRSDGDVDTLGTAVSDKEGRFSMTIMADQEGVYPFIVSRSGATLSVDEFVAVDGDSVSVTGTYPLGSRRLRMISPENAAWSAYRNAKAVHNQTLASILESDESTRDDMRRQVMQTSSIMWSIWDSYPETIAASLARAEAIAMLETWDDRTVLDRLSDIDPSNRLIEDVVRVARRSAARVAGQDSALAIVQHYMDRIDDDEARAALHAELVVAYSDSLQTDLAIQEASELRRKYPDSRWASWASRATYELENLMPGMVAPAFSVVNREGDEVTIEDLSGGFILLEFYDPTDSVFMREVRHRDAIVEALDGKILRALSMSVVPDSAINEAIFEESDHPGQFAYLPEGREASVARKYNVNVIPTRYLIDPDGRIVAKYRGPAMNAVEQDLMAVIQSLSDIQDRLQAQ